MSETLNLVGVNMKYFFYSIFSLLVIQSAFAQVERIYIDPGGGAQIVSYPVSQIDSITFDVVNSIFDSNPVFLPGDIAISQNYPNPFNPETQISFYVPAPGVVAIQVFDISGQLIKELHSGWTEAGIHNLRWDGRDSRNISVAGGVYIYKLQMNETILAKKMIILK
mgnify:CR=1 FL=1